MTKINLTDLVSLTNETSATNTINNNNSLIETALENTLSRDGTSPNSMGATLDMNSNRIINLPAPAADEEPLRKKDIDLLSSIDLVKVDYATRALAILATIPITQNTITTGGYTTLGDRGHATYTRTGSLDAGGFQSADGAFWKISPVNGVVNLLQFGANSFGLGDCRAAWDAMLSIDFAHKHIPSGVYTSSTGFPITSKNGLLITGDGWSNTTLQRSTNGDVIPITDSLYISLENFYVGRTAGPTYTTGSGISTSGTSSNVEIQHVRSNGHPRSGFLWTGTLAVQQSENSLSYCEAMSNTYAGIEAVYNNDFSIIENGFGDPNAGWNSSYGGILTNCSQYLYDSNRHWGHQVGVRMVNPQAPRFTSGNRVEMSSTNGCEIVGGNNAVIVGNVFHTNSQASLGTSYHLVLDTCTNSVVVGNIGMSWNTDSFRTNYFLKTLGVGSISLIGNDCSDSVNGMYDISSGTKKTIFDSSGSYISGIGNTLEYLDVRVNPSSTSFAGVGKQYWVGSVASPIGLELFQRVGTGNGGQYLLQLNDSSGVAQTRKLVAQDGRHFYTASATFTGATGALLDNNNATITRTGTGAYTLTAAASGTLPSNSHVKLGYLSASDFFLSRVLTRTNSAVTFDFQRWNGTTFVAADPTTVWIDVY